MVMTDQIKWIMDPYVEKKSGLICFRVTERMLTDLDQLVDEGLFVSRAEAIRVAIDGLLGEEGIVIKR